ncbi:ATP-grasp domain-containing protein [Providencia rettgeri]
MSKRLLIIEKNPSGSIGLKKAKELGIYILFIGSRKYYNRISDDDLNFIDEFYEADTNDDENILSIAKQLHSKQKIDGVITFMEFYVPLAAKVAEVLNLKGIGYDNALKARNKHLMRNVFKEKNVPIPRYSIVTDFHSAKNEAQLMGYPNIIKPINMAGSRGVLRNNNVDELEKHFSEIDGIIPPFGVKKANLFLIEEYLDGQEYSIETISFNGMTHIISITKKYVSNNGYFVELGHTLPATLPLAEENQIKAVVTQALQALNINDGGGHTEVKVTANGVKVIEVGARLGGDHIPELVEMATGIDMWKAVIQVALDIQPDVTPKTHKFASISYLTNPPGIVKNIIYPQSNALQVDISLGSQIEPLQNSGHRLGYAIACESTLEQAEQKSRRLCESVCIELETV